MVQKRLMAFWTFVDMWLLAAAVLSITMSFVWRAKNLMLNFTISNVDLTGAWWLHYVFTATYTWIPT